MAVILVLLTFTGERFISLARASGKGRISNFLKSIQTLLNENNIEEAAAACDKQKGSLANVVKAGLHRYRDLQVDQSLQNDQKVLALQKDLEEATALELPMLSQNLVILSTIASIAVLIGLIGTVLGMIRAFAALATQAPLIRLHFQQVFLKPLSIPHSVFPVQLWPLFFIIIFHQVLTAMTFKIDEA